MSKDKIIISLIGSLTQLNTDVLAGTLAFTV